MEKFELFKHLDQHHSKSNMLPFKKDILTAIEQGYSVKSIWHTFHQNNVLEISYHAFAYRVRQWKKVKRLPETPNSDQPKKLQKIDSTPKKRSTVFANWTGENLSNKELYGTD